MMANAFGVEHTVISKGSVRLGLKMIGAYGTKPSAKMGALRLAQGGGPRKATQLAARIARAS